MVDALTIDEVTDLFTEWNEDPPMGEVVKAFLGFERKPPESEEVPIPEITLEQWERMKANALRGVANINAQGLRGGR